MSMPPETRPSLLVRLREHRDGRAWQDFVEIYSPVVLEFCRRRGLQDADARDVAQDVLTSVSRAMESFEYDPERGTFRSWLYRVVRSKLSDHVAKRRRDVSVRGGTTAHEMLRQVPEPQADEDDAWDSACRRRVFAWAAERVRAEFHDRTWSAFWETAVRGAGAGEVAKSLDMSIGAVYVAKSRVLARLRACIQDAGGVAEDAADAAGGSADDPLSG